MKTLLLIHRVSSIFAIWLSLACSCYAVDQTLYSWGTNDESGRLNTPPSLGKLLTIDGGIAHTVALKVDGSIATWGTAAQDVPPNLSGIVDVDAGWAWSLARKVDGSLVSWGANDSGQITSTPTELGFVDSSMGNMHGVALRANGTVVCWGRNDMGQSNVPSGLTGVIAVSAQNHNTAALRSDGTVVVWGNNGFRSNEVPQGLANVAKISCGGSFILALKHDGTLVAWGDNSFGQTDIPSNLDDVESIYTVGDTAFAIRANGAVVGWGYSSTGNLSIPTLSQGQEWKFIGGGFEHVYGLATHSGYTIQTLEQPANGYIEGLGDYLPGQTATLTAIPSPGYSFASWIGDASGTTNPLAIVINSNKSVGANFAPDLSDADGDLLTAFEEVTLHGTDPTKADTDGDGLNDGFELGIGRFAVVLGGRTWAQAKTHAESQGGTLATFANENEWGRALLSIGAGALYDIGGLWIGATDDTTDGIWTWITGEPFSFFNWAAGQPDNLNDSDYAAVAGELGGTVGDWYDYRATTTRDGYILETGYTTDPTDSDCDNDGLDDGAEQLAGSNPFASDTDGDGLSDTHEVNLTHTHPKSADTDGDGIRDANDDEDNDSLTNVAEITQHGTDPLKADTDEDGLSDSTELSHPGSYFALFQGSLTYPQAAADAAAKRGRVASFPNRADYSKIAIKARQSTQGFLWIGLSDAAAEGVWVWTDGSSANYDEWLSGQPDGQSAETQAMIAENSSQWADAAASFVAAGYLLERVGLNPLAADTDSDGLTDGQEVATVHSDPAMDDTDGDGLLDGAEVITHGSSPLKADTDDDGLYDREEVENYNSNPTVKDSDGDGFDDLFEVTTGFDPTLPTSTPDALSSIRTAVEFRFNAANGISYRIEASTDLNEWAIVEADIIGQGGVVTRFYSIENQPNRYFRAKRN